MVVRCEYIELIPRNFLSFSNNLFNR
jgi:hypothetical protein